MLTIFATPKPFYGDFGFIQRNAILSWLHLDPKCEIILFGNGEGVAEVAGEFGVHYISKFECNEFGTPLVSSLFKIAQNISHYDLLAYVNADIILMSDFMEAIRSIKKFPFLMVGQRFDMDISSQICFDDHQWESWLRLDINKNGKLHAKTGIDYFVFNRNLFKDIPSFAIGRSAWDNWLIYNARFQGVPVIDATKVITAVHQNHNYSHYVGGEDGVWKGPEAKYNLKLARGSKYLFNLSDATHILIKNRIVLAFNLINIWRYFYNLSVFNPLFLPLRWLLYALLNISKFFRKTSLILVNRLSR
ncbi:hypothetical protein D4R78_01920 [bacterium]|nr:MAG: hypothetical protein D4R78_01920 [bacterium]